MAQKGWVGLRFIHKIEAMGEKTNINKEEMV
jgi:hypothetical protein